MRYLLDTDHLSILQRQTGQDYNVNSEDCRSSTRRANYPVYTFLSVGLRVAATPTAFLCQN